MDNHTFKEINIEDWDLFSHRPNSDNYFSKDKTRMLKLQSGMSMVSVDEEYFKSKAAEEAGVPTPRAIEIVTYGERRGIIYENIQNKMSFAAALRKDPGNVELYGRRFAKIAKRFHAIELDESVFEDKQKSYLDDCLSSDVFTSSQKKEICSFMDGLDRRRTCIISDFNPSNFLMAGDEEYVIDLSNMGFGHPYFDLASLYSYLFLLPIKRVAKELKVTPESLLELWKYFIREYFESEDDEFIARKENEIRLFAPIATYGFLSHEDLSNRQLLLKVVMRMIFRKTLGKRK